MERIRNKILVIALLAAGLQSLLSVQGNAQNGQKKTWDVEDLRVRDPFIWADKSTRTYYFYQSSGLIPESERGNLNGVVIYESKDLMSWTGPTPVFEIPDNFWADRSVWAHFTYSLH